MEERDIVIVGAGPAGLSAAIFTQLDGWDTLVLEGNWAGGQAAIAYTVINYPGFPPGDGATLVENMKSQVTSKPPAGAGAEIRKEKVLKIDKAELVVSTDINQYKAKAIILATGSNMQHLGVPGEEKFAGNGVSYYAKLDAEEFADKKVLIVGGGNTTAKSALLAKSKASSVTLIHRRESLRAYPAMVKRLQKEGIEILYDTEVKELKGNERLEKAIIVNDKTGEERELLVDWVVICVGTEPDVQLARDSSVEVDRGYIKIDERMMTDKPGIFACGEITGCDRHMISSAAQGAMAGMSASEYLALEMVKRGEIFEGAKNGKYADEYLAMLR